MPLLMDAFGLPVGRAGLLMSVFSITGLVLAIPAGFIYQRLGYRTTFLIAFLSMMLGSVSGALSTGAAAMLASRVVEGLGLCMITMAAPPLIRLLFAEKERGRAMAVWVVYVPLGQMIVFGAAPYITALWGWRGIWWSACAYTACVALLFFLFVKPAGKRHGPSPGGQTAAQAGKVLLSRDLWLLCLLFLSFNFVFIAFRTWMPTFLYSVKGLPAGYGSFLMAFMSVFIIAPAPLVGRACDAIGSRRLVCIISMLIFAAMLPLASIMSPFMLIPWLALLGVICAFLPTALFLAATDLIRDERSGGLIMAVIQTGPEPAGCSWARLAFGAIVGGTQSWYTAFWLLAPMSIAGGCGGVLYEGKVNPGTRGRFQPFR